MSVKLRVIAAALILFAFAALAPALGIEHRTWAEFALGMLAVLAVSAVLPHYMWRGEPLFPDRHKRR